MWSRNQSQNGRMQPDGGWRPPLPPRDHGNKQASVPLWEREFCSSVGNISWQRFCENKRYVSILVFSNLKEWDDSGALENFQNAKTRFWANYHGQPSDVPLPDPDMYIAEIDHHCKVDPELVADLDKVWEPPVDSNSTPVLEWPSAGLDSKYTQNQSEIWDVDEWEWKPCPGSNATWGGNNESSSKWPNSNTGLSGSLEKPSRRNWRNNQYASKKRYSNIYGGSNNNRYFKQTNNKKSVPDKGFQQRGRWQDPKGKKDGMASSVQQCKPKPAGNGR